MSNMPQVQREAMPQCAPLPVLEYGWSFDRQFGFDKRESERDRHGLGEATINIPTADHEC
jgi:hypothetical protein